MKWIKYIAVVILFSSCAQVFFLEPQPQKGTTLKSFIEDVQGGYADSILQIEVTNKQLIIEKEIYDLTSKAPLENQVLVKYYKDFYFTCFVDSIYYSVYMAKFYENKLALYMLNADKLSISRLQRLINVEVLDSINQIYLVAPTKKEFDDIINFEMFEVINILEKIK